MYLAYCSEYNGYSIKPYLLCNLVFNMSQFQVLYKHYLPTNQVLQKAEEGKLQPEEVTHTKVIILGQQIKRGGKNTPQEQNNRNQKTLLINNS